MQFFGRYDTKFDEEFLVESYLYFNKEDEELSEDEFRQLIKTQKLKKKNIAGTIFMYSPFYFTGIHNFCFDLFLHESTPV